MSGSHLHLTSAHWQFWSRRAPRMHFFLALITSFHWISRLCSAAVFALCIFFLSAQSVRWPLLCTSNPWVNCGDGALVSIELDFAGPLDPSHKNEAKVCYFHFYLVLGWCATQPRSAAGTRRVPPLFTCFYLEKEDNVHTSPHTSRCSKIRLVGSAVISTMMHRGGGRNVVTWSSRERRRVSSAGNSWNEERARKSAYASGSNITYLSLSLW